MLIKLLLLLLVVVVFHCDCSYYWIVVSTDIALLKGLVG